MKFCIADIIVADRKRDLGDISPLAQSIKEIGLLQPIIIEPNGRLTAGYHRLEACKYIGWTEIDAIIRDLEPLKKELAEIDENLIRNELTALESSRHLQRRKMIHEELHPETKHVSERGGPGRGHKTGADSAPVSFTKDTAKKTGIAPRTIQENTQIAKNIPTALDEKIATTPIADSKTDLLELAKAPQEQQEAIIEKVAKKKAKNVKEAKRQLKEQAREQQREENRQTIEQAPTIEEALKTAKFNTIVIDPPWDWGDEGDNDQLGRAKPTYATMSIEKLLKLPVGGYADEGCHLYLWITNRSLPKGFQLLERWGFRYVTCITWVKPSFGMGNYFRGQTEHILFGVKGSQPLKRKDAPTYFNAPRGPNGHSSKPLVSYDFIESCSPGPYLEIFARSERSGWTPWGGEV